MHYFLRALREAAKNWPLLAAAMLCSAAVAALWSANIAALHPIIEVTLKGESLQSWNQREVAAARERIEGADAERTAVHARLAGAAVDGAELATDRNRLALLEQKQAADGRVVAWGEWLGPWLDRLLPIDPFKTVLVVVAFVVVSTVLKHVLLLTGTMLVSWVAMDISRTIRSKVFDKALELDRAQFMRQGSAGFMAQVTHTADMLASGITTVYGGAITEPLKILRWPA
jgi:ATP-binding cassette subfamily B protein/subfamily B ATP-binding cassette protein MsbA